MSLTRAEFIRKIKDDVVKDAKISRILPSLTIAQAILESNNGNSGLAVKGKALFGIKATNSWKGKVYVSDTKEVYSGVQYTVKASFRAYNNWAESIADHTKLLTSSKRYSNIIGEKNYIQACKKIQQDGYATDPYYASKLINIIEANQLFNYDDYEEEDEMIECKAMYIDGKEYKNVNQINKDGRVYVELDSLKQAGYNIGYNSVKKTASFAKKPEEIDMLVNNKQRKINRVLIYNENYVKLRDFEKCGMTVGYDSKTKRPSLVY